MPRIRNLILSLKYLPAYRPALFCLFFVCALAAGLTTFLFTRPALSLSVSLDQILTEKFPSLAESMAWRSTFEQTSQNVNGRDVVGLALSGGSEAGGGGLNYRAAEMAPGLKPAEQEALLSMSGRDVDGGFKAFFPQCYTDSFVVKSGTLSVALRAVGANQAEARIENGKVVYRGAYADTDSLHVVRAGRSEEFLYLYSEKAPRRFQYEIIALTGEPEVSLEDGAVRFKDKTGRDLQIEAPWVIDASGTKRGDVVRWELGEIKANGERILSLLLEEGADLSYPLVIDPSWSQTGSLNASRSSETATLLQNGKVLVAAGYYNNYLSSAELYDPATGLWNPTGSLNVARTYHTATLLPDGKVLIVGGRGSSFKALNSTELYDPTTGTWTLTGSLNDARFYHTATLLQNGKVLVVGGSVDDSNALNSAELYDPATGTWTRTGNLSVAHTYHTATLLPEGKVLVAAGSDSGILNSLNSAELYDPATGLWTPVGNLNAARYNHTATLLPNGKVLVAGGRNRDDALNSTELYDPASRAWTPTGNLHAARTYHSSTLLPGGKVLVAGGHDGYSLTSLDSTELYDPATGLWTPVGNLNIARRYHAATLLPNGLVLIICGYNNHNSSAKTAELYDPATGTWATASNLNAARIYHTTTLLQNGKVLVAAGYYNNYLSSAELYDPATGLWNPTGSLNVARNQHTATLLPHGKVLIAGGSADGFLSSAELYDPATGTWTRTGNLSIARDGHRATLLPDGKVLVTGGYNSSFGALNSTELYDQSTGTWTSTNNLNVGRYGHTVTLLPGGKVLVAGGRDSNGTLLSSAELYDPSTGTWTTTNSLTAARYLHAATLLPNGKVLITGGHNSSFIPQHSAELYDPATGLWTSTGGLNAARVHHTMTLLPNGKVLVAAGYDGSSLLSSAELYDPATGLWSATNNLNVARNAPGATLLPDGKVLVAGGADSNAIPLSSAELYDIGLGFSPGSQPVINSATARLWNTKLVLSGTRFKGVSGASGDNYQSSPTNYPLVQLRSLVNDQSLFLLPDSAAGWSETSFTSQAVTGFPAGYALVTVFANGTPSASKLVLIARELPTFSDLSSPVFTYGTSGTILSGKITGSSSNPTGSVSITLNGVTQQATILGDGTFSSSFNTSTMAASTYKIIYRYEGDTHFDAAGESTKTLTINKATPAITWMNPVDTTYGTPLSATQLNATASTQGTFTYTPAAGTVLNAGANQTLSVNFTPTDTANYNNASKSVSITVSKADQTITFAALPNRTFGDADFPLSATSSSGLLVSFSAVGNCAVVSGNMIRIAGAGSCIITASQAGDNNYNSAPEVARSFEVSKAATVTVLSSSANPSVVGQVLTFTASVTSAAGTASGPVQFKDNGNNLGAPVPLSASGQATLSTSSLTVGTHAITAEYAGNVDFAASTGTLSGGQVVNNPPKLIELASASYTINEAAENTAQGFGALAVEVVRSGDLSQPASVRYHTSDQSAGNECDRVTTFASQRCDYATVAGTLRFAAGEGSKRIQISIIRDGYVEGNEVFTIQLQNPSGADLGTNNHATITIQDSGIVTTGANNPYLSNELFVRMNYLDFLGREPDADGFTGWSAVLNNCGPEKGFLGAPPECDRPHVSHGFFGAPEFINGGFLIHRLYEVGLNRLPRFSEFTPDMASLSGFGLPDDVQQQNLQDYLQQFTSKPEFQGRFQGALEPSQAATLIEKLEHTAGVALPDTVIQMPEQPIQYGRQQLINLRAAGTLSVGQTLKAFVEQQPVYDKYFARGQVTMLYFAYLKRDPDLNDSQLVGWNEWVKVFNNGGVRSDGVVIEPRDIHHLIFGFIYSEEYRKRFGQP